MVYSPETPRLYLCRKSAAAALDVSPSTFDRWVDVGIIPKPVFTEGRKSLWRETDLANAIEGRHNKPGRITDPDEAVKRAIKELRDGDSRSRS